MTNKAIDIPLKLVVVERNYGAWTQFRVTATPVNTEALLGPIYQLKAGTTLHRIYAKNRAVTAAVLVGEDAIVVKEGEEVVEYINKADLEPYELSDYDKERLAEYNKKINGKDLFDKIVMPNILAIIKEYDLDWAKNKKYVSFADKSSWDFNYRRSDHKERYKEIVDKFKALGCRVIIPNCGMDICRININQSAADMGLG